MRGMWQRVSIGKVGIAVIAAALIVTAGMPVMAADLTGTFATQLSVNLESPHAIAWRNWLDLQIDEPLGPIDVLSTIRLEQKGSNVSFDMSEASLVWYGEKTKIQVGRSILNWGTAMKLNPTNVVNPLDPFDPEMGRKPVQLAAVTYYPTYDWELTGVWIPEFQPSVTGFPGGSQIPVTLPGNALEDSEVAARAIYRGRGFDLSVVGFVGWEDFPHVTFTPQGPAASFRRMSTAGIGYATSLTGAGLWAEGRYSLYSDGDAALEAVIGGDYRMSNGVQLLGQVRWLDAGNDPSYLVMAAAEGTFSSIHAWRVGLLANPAAEALTIQPEIEFSLADALTFAVNTSLTTGDPKKLGPAAGADQIGIMLKSYF